MIVYNVTINVPNDLVENWLEWMKNEHIIDVISTACFHDYRIWKIHTEKIENDESTNYSVQYFARTMELYDEYINHHATKLRDKTKQKFGDRLLAFRTLLEEV